MTTDELRELDAEVHEKVFGLGSTFDIGDLWGHDEDGDWGDESEPVPHYSSDIEAAWLVVEKMDNVIFNLQRRRGVWMCAFAPPARGHAAAETAPLAICKAALKEPSTEGAK